MTLFLATSMQAMPALATGGSVSASALSQHLNAALRTYERTQRLNDLLHDVELGLTQAHELALGNDLTSAQPAQLAHSLAGLTRQHQSFLLGDSSVTEDQIALLFREAEQVIDRLNGTEGPGDGGGPGPADWGQLAADYRQLLDSGIFERGHFPLLHGLGQMGLSLGARIALKLDGAQWFGRLTRTGMAHSAEVYLYGRSRGRDPEPTDLLNKHHRVPEKQLQAEHGWIHHAVRGIGRSERREQQRVSPIQVTGIPSKEFVQELYKDDYGFMKQMPQGAILVSPIKSYIAPDVYFKILKDYAAARRDRGATSDPIRVQGGASMEDIYDMVRYITGREDIKTVHIGGEYFAKNLYMYSEEPPRHTELVFASKDIEAAEQAARYFRIPEQLEVSITDDVSTVMLGGVLKNIAAYAMGFTDLEEMERLYRSGDEGACQRYIETTAGENGYVDSPRDLSVLRRRWWKTFVDIAEGVKGEPVDPPRELLKDFCGCTIFNRNMVADLFRSIRSSYDLAQRQQGESDWSAFRLAVHNFRDQVGNFANSRNRRGGLLHAMAIFIKEELKRPEEAALLFWDKTVEGYQAMRGLRATLSDMDPFLAAKLDLGFKRFYTEHGVPLHPELDPLEPKAIRDAVVHGIENKNFSAESPMVVSAQRIKTILEIPWLTRTAYNFLTSKIEDLYDHVASPERDHGRVERDFRLFNRALRLFDSGVQVRSGVHIASEPAHPYRYISRFEGRVDQGRGDSVHHYHIGIEGDQGLDRVRDVSLLLSHHQSRLEPAAVKIEIEIFDATREMPRILWATQNVANRFSRYQGAPIHVDFVFHTPTGSPRVAVSSEPVQQKPVHWQFRYDKGMDYLISATGLNYDELTNHFKKHGKMINAIVGRDGWIALGATNVGKYSAAFRDALQVAGEKAFFGVFSGLQQEYPDEVVVGHFDSDGDLRLYDRHIQELMARDSERPQPDGNSGERDWDAYFRGLPIAQYQEAYTRLTGKPFGQLRPLNIYFPLEAVLVGARDARLSPQRLFVFLQNLKGDRAKEFAEWIEPRHFREPNDQLYLDIRDRVLNMLRSM